MTGGSNVYNSLSLVRLPDGLVRRPHYLGAAPLV